MDTTRLNKRLIEHYATLGFGFLGTKVLEEPNHLPVHYKEGAACLFKRKASK